MHPSPPLLATGAAAPAIALQSDTGQSLDVLAMSAHHPAVVAFFETSCAVCQQDAEALCAASNAFPGVAVVAVDAGGASASALLAFAAQYLMPPCHVTVLVDPRKSAAHSYQVAVVPTIYVIDSNRKIAYGGVGAGGIHGVAAVLHQLNA